MWKHIIFIVVAPILLFLARKESILLFSMRGTVSNTVGEGRTTEPVDNTGRMGTLWFLKSVGLWIPGRERVDIYDYFNWVS